MIFLGFPGLDPHWDEELWNFDVEAGFFGGTFDGEKVGWDPRKPLGGINQGNINRINGISWENQGENFIHSMGYIHWQSNVAGWEIHFKLEAYCWANHLKKRSLSYLC